MAAFLSTGKYSPSRAETCIFNPRSAPTTTPLGAFAILTGAHCVNWGTTHSCSTSLSRVFCLHSSVKLSRLSRLPVSGQFSPHRSFATRFFLSHLCRYASQPFFSSAMGKSRSATVVIAYLMQEHNISPSEALSHLRQARSICEPNDGFMKQLELYGEMHTPENVEQSPAYQRWVYQREIELSRACGQAPEADKIRFEDEHVADQNSAFELRCRKCR